jgi:hypothetical protein
MEEATAERQSSRAAVDHGSALVVVSSVVHRCGSRVREATYLRHVDSNGLCGTTNNPCEVPVGRRLIIEHISGFVLVRNTADTATDVSFVITAPQLSINGSGFHVFVATKTATTPIPGGGGEVAFAFSTPFRMMLPPGATFYFSQANAVAVSGYLVRQ